MDSAPSSHLVGSNIYKRKCLHENRTWSDAVASEDLENPGTQLTIAHRKSARELAVHMRVHLKKHACTCAASEKEEKVAVGRSLKDLQPPRV